MKKIAWAALAAVTLLPVSQTGSATAASLPMIGAAPEVAAIEQIQWRPGYNAGPRYVVPRVYARPYAVGPRYVPGPRFAPAPRYFAPRGYVGRPYWYARPWAARPYYGRLVGGVALGTLITVAAIGYAPRRPADDLCWYWADNEGSRGYWDYCS